MVSNLARPGGNITGLSFMSSDLAAKRLEVLKQTFPRIARVAVLYLPAEVSTVPELRETEAAARTISVTLQPLEVRYPDDLEPLFARATRERADALLVFAHAFAFVHRDRIVELAARQRLPTVFGWREFVDVGGLMSYGPNVHAMLRRAAAYVDRILKGAKPGGPPDRAADHVRTRHQPEDGEGAQPDDPAIDPVAGGPGHRVARARPARPNLESWRQSGTLPFHRGNRSGKKLIADEHTGPLSSQGRRRAHGFQAASGRSASRESTDPKASAKVRWPFIVKWHSS